MDRKTLSFIKNALIVVFLLNVLWLSVSRYIDISMFSAQTIHSIQSLIAGSAILASICILLLLFKNDVEKGIAFSNMRRKLLSNATRNIKSPQEKNQFQILETERKKIAGELHDSLNNILATASLMLQSDQDPEIKNKEALGLLRSGQQELRRISRNLYPKSIDHYGWEVAVEQMVEVLNRSKQIKVSFLNLDFDNSKIPQALNIHIFRILQELVSNAINHSECKNIRIVSKCFQNEIKLLVENDNSKLVAGIDPDRCFELQSIQQRLSNIGGRYFVHRMNKGLQTRVLVIIPISSDQGAIKQELQFA